MSLDRTDQLICLTTSIPPQNGVRGAFSQLIAIAPPPHGAPCSHYSSRGFHLCIYSALSTIESPNENALAIRCDFHALEIQLQKTLTTNSIAESLIAIDGTKTRHPEWHFFASTGAKKQAHLLTTVYVGLKSLVSIRTGKPLSKSAITTAVQLLKEYDLSAVQIKALFHGTPPDQTLGQSWPRDLCRTWREVMRHFSSDGNFPPPSTKERLAGQILDAALHATASRRAGARSHRNLSKSQLHQALTQIGMMLEQDKLQGALGALVCISTFSVDVVADLRLKSNSMDASWLAQIDVAGGLLAVDYSLIAHEASAPIVGAIVASYICWRPLPQMLAQQLRNRATKYPHARTLRELFPDEAMPAHDSPLYACSDQIRPTWARLRRVIGTSLREAGMDNLLASIVSGDFTHVPRSKLYYSCVSSAEIATAFEFFYKLAGWTQPTRLSEPAVAFGCQVVPTRESLFSLDQHWRLKVFGSRPGKHCSIEKLIKFHNNFMCWTGMRMSLLLALRESDELSLCAEINERLDRWIPIHDKHVPGDHGAMPVPLTDWARLTIQSVRAHCKAMRSRLQSRELKDCDLARWCAAVWERQRVPLLCVATAVTSIRPVGTADFISNAEIKKLVPPDFGRKAMENLLRTHGLRASEIDAILRHALQGQTTNCVTSDTVPMVRWSRANQAVSKIALSTFKEVGFGLAKE